MPGAWSGERIERSARRANLLQGRRSNCRAMELTSPRQKVESRHELPELRFCETLVAGLLEGRVRGFEGASTRPFPLGLHMLRPAAIEPEKRLDLELAAGRLGA